MYNTVIVLDFKHMFLYFCCSRQSIMKPCFRFDGRSFLRPNYDT